MIVNYAHKAVQLAMIHLTVKFVSENLSFKQTCHALYVNFV